MGTLPNGNLAQMALKETGKYDPSWLNR